jgi:hypothetical protein
MQNKGQISNKKLLNKLNQNLEYLRFAQISPKRALKYTIFANIQKGQKWPNGLFYF